MQRERRYCASSFGGRSSFEATTAFVFLPESPVRAGDDAAKAGNRVPTTSAAAAAVVRARADLLILDMREILRRELFSCPKVPLDTEHLVDKGLAL